MREEKEKTMNQEQQSYVTLTDRNFQREVIESQKPVLVDFWAPWCGPCQAMGPVIKELAEEFQSRAVVGKVDVDNNPDIAARYGIQSIPTLMIFQNGEVVDQMVGTMSKTALAQKLESQRQPA
jgi:thioredoxin 1